MPSLKDNLKRLISRPVRVLVEAALSFNDDNSFIHASSVSFYFILSIIPFVLFAISFAGNILKHDPALLEAVYKGLSLFIARTEALEWLKNFVDTIIKSSGTTTITGVISLLFVSVGMFRSLEYVMNHTFGVRPRGYIRSYLIGISFSLILNILLILAVVASPLLNILSTAKGSTLHQFLMKMPWMLTLFNWMSNAFIFALICFLIYLVLPNTRQRFRDVFWGAVTAGLLWNLLKLIFDLYQSIFTGSQPLLGTFAYVLGAIFWMYLSTSIIIYGAEVCMILSLRSKGVPAPSFAQLFSKATRRIGLSVPWVSKTAKKPPGQSSS